MYQIYLLLLLHLVHPLQTPRLVFVQSIFRHGDKYPSHLIEPRIYKLFANQKYINPGQLTNQGKASHYLLGKKMYDTYWKRLFSNPPNENQFYLKKIMVTSTRIYRTIQSAQSHLFGLLQSLPPLTIQAKNITLPYDSQNNVFSVKQIYGKYGKAFHPIPINIEPGKQDLFQRYSKIIKSWSNTNFNSEFSEKIKRYQPFLKAFRKFEKFLNLANGTINIFNYNKYYNNEECMKSLGYASIIEPNSVFDSLNGIIFGIRFFLTEQQRKQVTTQLIGMVIKNIKNYISNNDAPQWAIYSDHELAILMVLSGLNMMSPECIFQNYTNNITNSSSCVTAFPAFTSILIFEVFQYSNKTYTFKVSYNGKYYQIPLCNGQKECQFQKLSSWFDAWKDTKNKFAPRSSLKEEEDQKSQKLF